MKKYVPGSTKNTKSVKFEQISQELSGTTNDLDYSLKKKKMITKENALKYSLAAIEMVKREREDEEIAKNKNDINKYENKSKLINKSEIEAKVKENKILSNSVKLPKINGSNNEDNKQNEPYEQRKRENRIMSTKPITKTSLNLEEIQNQMKEEDENFMIKEKREIERIINLYRMEKDEKILNSLLKHQEFGLGLNKKISLEDLKSEYINPKDLSRKIIENTHEYKIHQKLIQNEIDEKLALYGNNFMKKKSKKNFNKVASEENKEDKVKGIILVNIS